MLAAYVTETNADDPMAALEVGDRPAPEAQDGWAVVDVKAAAINHHDVWSLKGQGLPDDRLPMILGCDAAGVDADGNEVIVHSVVPSGGWSGDETLDPKRSLLSELHQGTLAEQVVAPKANLIPKPAGLSFEEAACLPTAWLTAYRMLFTRAQLQPGQTALVQGAGGGVATACIALGSAAGIRVYATTSTDAKRERAKALGAVDVLEHGARLPERVDAVMETVGDATWSHSLKSLKPGGKVVVVGATSGAAPSADLNRVFFLQLQVLGSTMGTRDELRQLAAFMVDHDIKPTIDRTIALSDVREGFQAMVDGELIGKVVVSP